MTNITSIRDTTTLHNGVEMPWFGLGVFKAQDGREVKKAIWRAIDHGYRSVDTASIYDNEAGVGKAIATCGVPRDELFITTKVWNADQGYDSTLRACDDSLKRLGMDCVDLYLVHWPVKGKYKETWRAMEKLYADGKARAIGVSNFLIHHLEDVLADCEVTPMVNQVEFHPYLVQQSLLDLCEKHKVRVEAWSPIMRGRVVDIPELVEIAKRYDKTPVQLVLRWDLQKGVVTIPKSIHKDRIRSNADIFDFEISDGDMAAIDALDRNERVGPDPDNFSF